MTTEITWTNCAERMPPKTTTIIVKSSTDKAFISIGYELHAHKLAYCRSYGTNDMFNSYEYKWTPYTPEKWKELNHEKEL